MPARRYNIVVQPTLGGIVKSAGFQNRPPFTAYSLLNIWPRDPFTARQIIASRPPLHPLTSPSGFVTMLQNVSGVVTDQPTQSILGAFGGDLSWWNGSGWTAATGGVTVPTDRPTFAATLFEKVYIPIASAKPAVFDYATGAAATLVETAGTAPSDTRIATQWLGAIWLAGALADPHILYASRAGDPTDWDFSAPVDDEFGAFFTSTDNEGAVGAPITALAPQTNDVMIVSTLSGLTALRAHPRQGGSFDSLSPTYMLGQGAWAKTPDDTLFFMTPRGLMSLQPGAYTVPTMVSKGKIPEELIGLDYEYESPTVSMAYDARWNGIIIAVRGAQEQAWLYDLDNGGFFRMEITGYPYVLLDHEPFLSDQSSGTLWGGVNLRFFDKFGDEDFETQGIIGPIDVSGSGMKKGKVVKLKAIFGGDTPTGTGTLAIAMGTDGQDAITRAEAGNHQYEIPLEKLALNDGVCYPQVSGQAMAIEFATDDGIVAIEQIELEIIEAGVNRLPRATQLSPEGEPIDFEEVEDVFDDENWQGYSEATPAVPDCTLADYTLFVDLSLMPDDWWSVVNANGADIRVTNNLNVEVPRDLVHFDAPAKTGFLTLKMAQQNPPTPVRVWAGNPFVGDYAEGDTNGQYAAYDDDWRAFYPDGGGNDRTQYENDLSMVGAEAGDSAGIIGTLSTDYQSPTPTNTKGVATNNISTEEWPSTLIAVAKRMDESNDNGSSGPGNIMNLNAGSENVDGFGIRDITDQSTTEIKARARHQNTSIKTANTAVVATTTGSTWHHIAGSVVARDDDMSAYIDGGNKDTETNALVGTPEEMAELVVGNAGFQPRYKGLIALAQYHTAVRNDCWIDYQNQMLDQATFWGTWDDFVEVNDPEDISPSDPDPPVASCPTGFDPVTETGTWDGYAEATPQAPTANMPNWVHWIDLADMPTEWWAAVETDGSDIRATDSADVFIPIDLIEFDHDAQTGFAAVRLNQSAASPAAIRLWVGNADAVTLSACATHGQYRVYDQYWLGFWPSGGGNDRTQYRNHMTAVGSPTVGGVTGPIGNTGTNYDGSQYSFDSATSHTLQSYPATLSAVARTSDFTQTGAVVSAARSQFLSHDTILHVPDPASAVVRFAARANEKTHHAVSETVVSSNTWTHEVGFSANNITRGVVVAGGTLFSSPKKSLAQRPFTIIGIGARRTGSGEVFWPFTGDISLVSAHTTTRATDNSWAAYQAAMLDQGTFWGSWTWTAETSDLDQS